MKKPSAPILPDPTQPFTWDPAKAESNLIKHGVSFEIVYDFDFGDAVFVEDPGRYGEQRHNVIGPHQGRFHLIVIAYEVDPDDEEKMAIISARLATASERKTYEREKYPEFHPARPSKRRRK